MENWEKSPTMAIIVIFLAKFIRVSSGGNKVLDLSIYHS